MAAGSGHTVVTLTAPELDAWKKSSEPVYKKYADDVKAAGYDPEKVLGDLRKTLTKFDALAK